MPRQQRFGPSSTVTGNSCSDGDVTTDSVQTIPSPRWEGHRRAVVALIDEFPLRRAGTLNLLRLHLREGARSFGSVAQFLTELSPHPREFGCVIVAVGGRSVSEPRLAAEFGRLAIVLSVTPKIVLSDRDGSEEVVAAFRQGARGYIPTNLEPRLVIEALRIVLAGGTFLPADALIRVRRRSVSAVAEAPESDGDSGKQWPPRELAVLSLLAQGKANKDIARALTMEECTVKAHVGHIMRKLGVRNRMQAALSARRLGVPAALDGVTVSEANAGPAVAVAEPERSVTPV